MKQYLRLFSACVLGLTMALSYATAQSDSGNNTNDNNQQKPQVTDAQAKALKDQYAAAAQLNKDIAELLAKSETMDQRQFEDKMENLLDQATEISKQMKRHPALEEQQAIFSRSITASRETLDNLKAGNITQKQATTAVRRLRAPLGQLQMGIASFLRSSGLLNLIAAYLASINNPDNTQISPEV